MKIVEGRVAFFFILELYLYVEVFVLSLGLLSLATYNLTLKFK